MESLPVIAAMSADPLKVILPFTFVALAVCFAVCALPGLRNFIGTGWLLFGPIWSVFVKDRFKLKHEFLKWRPTLKVEIIAAAEAAKSKEDKAIEYARQFLSEPAFISYSEKQPISKLASANGEPVSVWQRFEKGLPDVSPAAGTWTNDRVFAVASYILKSMDVYQDFGRADMLEDVGQRRCLDEEQVNAVFDFLKLFDPKNETGYVSSFSGAIECARNAPPGVIALRTKPLIDAKIPTVKSEKNETPKIDRAGLEVFVVREVGNGKVKLFRITAKNGESFNVVAASEGEAVSLLP